MRNFAYIFALIFIIGLFLSLTFRGVTGNPSQEDILNRLSQPGKAFETSQERARFSLIKSIADEKTFILDKYAKESLPDIAYKDGHYFSVFLPGLSLLSIPFYEIGKLVGQPVLLTFGLPAIASIVTAIFIFLLALCLGQSRSAAFISAISFSLCTVAWPYSVTYYAHTLSALCMIASLFFAFRADSGRGWNYLFVWLFYGVGFLIDYPNAIIMLPALFYSLGESIKLSRFAIKSQSYSLVRIRYSFFFSIIPFLLLIFFLFYYNASTFGKWDELAHSFRVTELVNNILNYYFLLSNVMDIKYVQNGLYTLLLSKSRGIFVYSPLMILSIIGAVQLYQRLSKKTLILLLTIFANLMVYAAFYDPWGGWSFGPRYLIISLPIFCLLVGEAFLQLKKRTTYNLIFIGFFYISFAISLLGAMSTNLLPPAAEVGKQVSFLSSLPFLQQNQTTTLAFSYFSSVFNITAMQYFMLLFFLSAVLFLPTLSYPIFYNIFNYFSNWKLTNIFLFRRRRNADAQN